MTVADFFLSYGFSLGIENEHKMLGDFLEDMEDGLAGRESTLQMIPSYISPGKQFPFNRPVPVLDAGGTNLRVATIQFMPDGKPEISNFVKTEMPGAKAYVSNEDFYDCLAKLLKPLVRPGETFGFCFSYSANVTPENDARLNKWSKNIQAPGIEGRLVGSDLSNCLAELGVPGTRAIVLNDTVATLLAACPGGACGDYSAYVGFILGTGTNTAYIERNSAITKIPMLPQDGSMVINCESGGFRRVPLSVFDKETDAQTLDPGYYLLEKAMAGVHMGPLGTVILRHAANDGLFSTEAARAILAHPPYSNIELDRFCAAPSAEAIFAGAAVSSDDVATAVELIHPIYIRAAHFASINMSAATIRAARASDKMGPVCINVDGSTFHKTAAIPFRATVEEHMKRLLAPYGVSYRIIHVDDSPMIGAAVAALTR